MPKISSDLQKQRTGTNCIIWKTGFLPKFIHGIFIPLTQVPLSNLTMFSGYG